MQAVRTHDLAGVEAALAIPKGPLEETDEQGFTPLLWAARGGYNGYTALMDAVTRNHLEVAAILVRAGARQDIAGHDGLTAFDIAGRNHNAMLQLLRQKP